jgi:nicotinamide mononucleotide (NMN) deamidase PncC
VGLVYIGFVDGRTARVLERQFVGDRADIKVLAAQTALDFLRRRLL